MLSGAGLGDVHYAVTVNTFTQKQDGAPMDPAGTNGRASLPCPCPWGWAAPFPPFRCFTARRTPPLSLQSPAASVNSTAESEGLPSGEAEASGDDSGAPDGPSPDNEAAPSMTAPRLMSCPPIMQWRTAGGSPSLCPPPMPGPLITQLSSAMQSPPSKDAGEWHRRCHTQP